MYDKHIVDALVWLCITHGLISRGKACSILEIDRSGLDDWIKNYAWLYEDNP